MELFVPLVQSLPLACCCPLRPPSCLKQSLTSWEGVFCFAVVLCGSEQALTTFCDSQLLPEKPELLLLSATLPVLIALDLSFHKKWPYQKGAEFGLASWPGKETKGNAQKWVPEQDRNIRTSLREDFWLFSSCAAGFFLILDLIIKYLSKIKHMCILICLSEVHSGIVICSCYCANECEWKTGLIKSLCQ